MLTLGPAGAGTQMDLQIAYAKNPARYSHLRCLQRIPSAKIRGPYLEMDPNSAARVLNNGAQNWADNSLRPPHRNAPHRIREFNTERDSKTAQLGLLATEQAQFALERMHAADKATEAMNNKLAQFERIATDPAVLTAVRPASDSDIGGALDTGTSANKRVKKAFNKMVREIIREGRGAVALNQIGCWMGPTTASKIAETAEVSDFLAGSPAARDLIMHGGEYNTFGLPANLYGVDITVANESFVTSKEAEDEPINSDDLNAAPANPASPVTFTEFYHEDMTVETFDDRENRVRRLHVTNNYDHKGTSPRTGRILRDVFGT